MRFWIGIVSSLCFASCAYAQVDGRDVQREVERLQERERERLRESERQFERSQIAPPKGFDEVPETQEPAEPTSCRAVERIELKGMTLYDPRTFLSDTRALIGPCVSTGAITELRRRITNAYVRDGYITSRALLSPRDDRPGVLEILVVEGRVGIIDSVADRGRRYTEAELDLAFPVLEGKPLNLRDIEQGVDQLARLPSADPRIDIVAAAAPGSSDVVVRRSRLGSWIRPNVSFSNDGTKLTGRRLATASLDADSPLGVGDFWSFYYLTDIEPVPSQGVEAFGGFLSVPYGATTLTLSGSRFRSQSVLRTGELAFQNTNASTSGTVNVSHLIFRDGRTKIALVGAVSLFDTVSRIQSIRLSTNSYRTVSGQIAVRAQRRVGGDLVSGEVAVIQGLDVLGADAADTGPGSDGVRFTKIEASAAYQAGFTVVGVPLHYSASFRAQLGFTPVLPADRLIIGGSSTVRGFRDDGISGRSGYVLRQQVSADVMRLFAERATGRAVQLSVFGGYDQGGIMPRKEDRFERGFLQSAALGARLQSRRLITEISVAAPLSAPVSVRRNRLEFAATIRLTI